MDKPDKKTGMITIEIETIDNLKKHFKSQNLNYILDFLEFQPAQVCKKILNDTVFLEELGKNCTTKGLRRFKRRLKLHCEVREEEEQEYKKKTIKALHKN